jgi:hypothetical protein
VDQLGPVAVVGIVVGVLYFAGGRAAEATQGAFEGYFRGYQPDPWPHGVQEMDIEHHWGTDSGERAGRTQGRPNDADAGQPEIRDLTAIGTARTALQPVRNYRVHSHV